MTSPARDTVTYLEGLGLASFGVDGFVGREPLSPVEAVTVYDSGGGTGPLIDIHKPTVQVRVRSNDYATGYSRAVVIRNALQAPIQTTETGIDAMWWDLTADVVFIGRDDQDRAIFTVNFEMTRDSAAL